MLTEQQRQLRANKLGSSDVAAVLGLDPYRSAADVFLEKTGQADGFEGNEATDRGNLLEPVLIEWARQQIGKNVLTNQMHVHPSDLLIANLDAVVWYPPREKPTAAIEAKTTVINEGWGEEGTDQVPERVLAQTAHQFVCVPSLKVIYIPVLRPGFKKFEWKMYRVERNVELRAAVEAQGLAFMRDHVVPRVPPSDFRPSLEVLKRIRREPNKIVTVADELVERYQACCNAVKLAGEQKEKAQSYLLASMGAAEGARYSGGLVTYFEVERKGYTVEPTTYRKLNVKKDKVRRLATPPADNPPMLSDHEISGAIDQASGMVLSDADSGL